MRGMTSHLDQARAGFKLNPPHSDECFVKDDPDAFAMYDGHDFDRDRIGRRGGMTLWHTFRCNDPDCPARMHVRWDTLSRFVTAASDEKRDQS